MRYFFIEFPDHFSTDFVLTQFVLAFFRYLFKRLRFLGNKTLSHVITLMFLAAWHGIYIGYFICFMTEYFYINAEKQVPEL
jgi:hypothetical protein